MKFLNGAVQDIALCELLKNNLNFFQTKITLN